MADKYVAAEDQLITDYTKKEGVSEMVDKLYRAFVDATHNVFQLMLSISEFPIID